MEGVDSGARLVWLEAQLRDLLAMWPCNYAILSQLCLSLFPTTTNANVSTTFHGSKGGLARQCLECLQSGSREEAPVIGIIVSIGEEGKSEVRFKHFPWNKNSEGWPWARQTGSPSIPFLWNGSRCAVLFSRHSIRFFCPMHGLWHLWG